MGTREKCKNENIIFTFPRYSEQCKYAKLPKKKKKKISPSPLENKWKLFPILFNSRIKKKLSENYFSPLNVISKAKLTIRQSFSTQLFAHLSRKRVESIRVLSNVWWYLLQNYSNHLCFSQSNLRRTPPRFISSCCFVAR